MKKKTVPSAQKMKGKKRWKKGHSSESNPSANKHRLAAKNRFFNVNTGQENCHVL